MTDFKPGDIVRLKSGGPKMIVRYIDRPLRLIFTNWFDKAGNEHLAGWQQITLKLTK